MAVQVIPSKAPVGAEVRGVNIAAGVSDEDFAAIRDALNRYSMVVLRDQVMTIPMERAFAARFGDMEYRPRHQVPGYTDVVCVSNILDEAGKPIGMIDAGRIWHTDSHFQEKPSMYSMLYAVEVPHDDDGKPLGPTVFASTARAYDRLPQEMKDKLGKLKAENSIQAVLNRLNAKGLATKRAPLAEGANKVAVHPVIRTHPFTGQKCIYVSEGHTERILGVSDEESESLIADLQQRVIGDDAELYQHAWKEGDLVIWDNCSAQHYAIADYALPARRLMYRISVAGEATF